MHTKNFNNATDLLLSKELQKRQNLIAFNKFVDQQTENVKNNYNTIIGSSSIKNAQSNFETRIEEDGTVVTIEYAKIPFVFVQSETIEKPDGSRTHTVYYASQEKLPAKQISFSAQSMITKTTMYDIKGKVKTETKTMTFADNSRVEEKFDAQYNRKTKTFFNKNNISTAVESYVNEQLVFKLECDTNGNLQKEYTFCASKGNSHLSREVTYHKNENYTVKEYTSLGNLYSCKTKLLEKQ